MAKDANDHGSRNAEERKLLGERLRHIEIGFACTTEELRPASLILALWGDLAQSVYAVANPET